MTEEGDQIREGKRLATRALEQGVRALAGQFLEASEADLVAYSDRLAAQLVYAQLVGGETGDALRKSVGRQSRLMAEAFRIRASDVQWEAFHAGALAASGVLSELLGGVLGGPSGSLLGRAITRGALDALDGRGRENG